MDTTPSRMALQRSPLSLLMRKLRSSFSTSIGRFCSVPSDEYPLPKSSMAMRKPRSFKRRHSRSARSRSSMTMFSVSSSSSSSMGTPNPSTMLFTVSGNASFCMCKREKLQAMTSGCSPASSCSRIRAQTRRNTCKSKSTTRPVRSNRGMNSSGGTRPRSGDSQRTSGW